jgi:hypothetical protein
LYIIIDPVLVILYKTVSGKDGGTPSMSQNQPNLSDWLKQFKASLGSPEDLKIHVFSKTLNSPISAILYLSSITDTHRIKTEIIELLNPNLSADSSSGLAQSQPASESTKQNNAKPSDKLPQWLMMRSDAKPLPLKEGAVQEALVQGKVIILCENWTSGLTIDMAQWKDRSIMPSDRENSLTGPQDSFIENIDTNLSMIRRRFRHHSLKSNSYTLGSKSRTQVQLLYDKDAVDPQVLIEITQKLDQVKIGELLLNSSQLAKQLTGVKFAPFPLYQNTERPDTAVSALTEGRLLLLVDTSPIVAIIPATMVSMYQTSDDYYFPSLSGSFMRIVRFLGMIITMFLPGIYIALTSVNQDILRIQFMLAIAASREGVPYPAYIEVIIMMVLLEFINEATFAYLR